MMTRIKKTIIFKTIYKKAIEIILILIKNNSNRNKDRINKYYNLIHQEDIAIIFILKSLKISIKIIEIYHIIKTNFLKERVLTNKI